MNYGIDRPGGLHLPIQLFAWAFCSNKASIVETDRGSGWSRRQLFSSMVRTRPQERLRLAGPVRCRSSKATYVGGRHNHLLTARKASKPAPISAGEFYWMKGRPLTVTSRWFGLPRQGSRERRLSGVPTACGCGEQSGIVFFAAVLLHPAARRADSAAWEKPGCSGTFWADERDEE